MVTTLINVDRTPEDFKSLKDCMLNPLAIRSDLNILLSTRTITHIAKLGKCNIIHITDVFGSYYCRLYWYDDDTTTFYLDGLSVISILRRNGIGTDLQELRELIAKNLGATQTKLCVESGSWMSQWYEHRGYEITCLNDNDPTWHWMVKKLN